MSHRNQRVALVTGSTSGIGLAIAQQLVQDGFTVAVHSKSSVAAGQSLATTFPGSAYFQADLSDQRQSRHRIVSVLDHYGRLEVLVNNAGTSATIPQGELKAATAELWRALYEVNVIAPWTLIAEAETALGHTSGQKCPSCILNISSHAALLAPKEPLFLMRRVRQR